MACPMAWMSRRSTFAAAALALALALAPGPSVAQPSPAERPCRDLPQFPIPAADTTPVGGPAAVGPPIAVPVIVHFMKTTDARFSSHNNLETVFKPTVITKLLKSTGTRATTVNAFWRQANIRLALHRVEECDYDPLVYEGAAPAQDAVPSPMAGAFGEALFNKVNGAFNFRDVRGLDLYIWMDIMGGLAGYGASHRSSGPQRVGAVWVDTGCRTGLGATRCTRLLAHEIGHFLGLCHSCESALVPSSGLCTVCLPAGETTAPSCAGVPVNRLMRATWDGWRLVAACEIPQARAGATNRINTPP